MRSAIISDGIVDNVIIAGEGFHPGKGCVLVALEEGATVSEGWRYDGTRFYPPTPPQSEVPEAVSARQARLILLEAGALDAVETLLAAIPGTAGTAARIEWEYATEIRRNSELVSAIAPSLGLTSLQIDDLFRQGATL